MSDLMKYIKNDPSKVGAEQAPFTVRNTSQKGIIFNEKEIKPGEEFSVGSKDALFFKSEGLLVLDDVDLEIEKDKQFEEGDEK